MATDHSVRRRRVLALTGAAMAGLAGCPGGSDSDSPTGTTARTNRTETGSDTTAGTTATPSATEAPAGFRDDFSAGDLDRYRPVAGSLDQWSVTSKIDGGSALVDTTGNGAASLIAPAADALTWPGTGTISADLQFGTGFRNCKLRVGDLPNGPSTTVLVSPKQLTVSAPNGDLKQGFPQIGADGVHRLTLTFESGTITAAVDDTHRIDLGIDESLPAGTVGFGIEAGRSGMGGKTWFDNLAIAIEG